MRKPRLLVAMVTALALLLTACGKVPTSTKPEGGGNTAAPTAESTITTIKFLSFGDPTYDALISAFYQKYPNYRVEKVPLQPGPNVNLTDILKEKLSRGEVDVTLSFGSPDQFVKENLLAPLEPFVQKAKFDLKGYGSGIDQLKVDGKLFGLPYTIQPQVIVYNKEVFESGGVPLPKAGWTWEDLRSAAAKLTKGDGDSKIWGFNVPFPDSLVAQYVNQKSGMAKLIDDPADIKEALQLFSTMIFTDKSMPQAPKREGNGPISVFPMQSFSQGKAAMSLESLSALRFAGQQAKFKWDVAPMPAIPGGKNTTQVNPQQLVIAANSKNQTAAWEFLSFICGPEGAQVLARQGQIPMWQSPEVKKAWFEQQPSPPPGTEALFATTYTIPARDPAIKPDKMSTDEVRQLFSKISSATNAALSGAKPWEEAYKDYLDAQEALRKAMQ